jgi:hypothetical protein
VLYEVGGFVADVSAVMFFMLFRFRSGLMNEMR